MSHYELTSAGINRPARMAFILRWSRFAPFIALAEVASITVLSWLIGAIYFAFVFGGGDAAIPHALFGAFVAIAFVLVSYSRGHYGFEKFLSKNLSDRTVIAWTAAFLLALAALFLLKAGAQVSRAGIVAFYIVGLLGLGVLRIAVVRLVRRGIQGGWIASRRVMLVGGHDEIDAFLADLRDRPDNGIKVVGTVTALPDRRTIASTVEDARALGPDGIVLLMGWSQPGEMKRWMDALMAVPTTIHLAPPSGLGCFRRLAHGSDSILSDLVLVRAPLSSAEQLAKRLFDIAVAALAFGLLAPLLLAIALLIRLDSRGPALFRQARSGFNNDTFQVYKFRTMVTDAEAHGFRQAVPGDARVTRIGRYLRRWNLDELPQLINVLLGDMSIVGPRPHPLALDHGFANRIAEYARRHNMKPGITGWAQVHGFRGPTETEDKMRARVNHDLYYIDNWSLWLDMKIMLLTIVSPRAFTNAC